jgi:hypothetical protein
MQVPGPRGLPKQPTVENLLAYIADSNARQELHMAELYKAIHGIETHKLVTIDDVSIKFTSMIRLLVIMALASIPAAIILFVTGFVFITLVASL